MLPCLGPIDRRTCLSTGLGGALSLLIPHWQSVAEARVAAKSCILLWMNGGPSHLETFDPKPGGRVGARKTRGKDMQISELLPHLAEHADKLAILRSMQTKEGNHDRGRYLLHTGYAPSVTVQHPSLGGWVSHQLGDPKFELPNFVSIRGSSVSAGFLGVRHNPFVIQQPKEGIRNLALAKDVDAQRFQTRLDALEFLQTQFQQQTGAAAVTNHNQAADSAVRLMRSPLVKAFAIDQEPISKHLEYGNSEFGLGCLQARRLIEAGVKFVEVTLDGWDTHVNHFEAIKSLTRELDTAMAALLKDLAERKLLEQTLVIWMGEFGRTPKINAQDGRDHHPDAWSTVLAGAGVRTGVHGQTDEAGGKVVKDPVTIGPYFATIAALLGMNPRHEEMSPVGRPIAIADNAAPIAALVGF